MELHFLGCGDSYCFTLGNNAAFFKEGRHLFFLDMGQSIFQKALEKGLLANVKRVTVFITHCHLDHIGSLGEAITYFSVFHPEIPFEIVYPNKENLSLRLGDLYPLDRVSVNEPMEGKIGPVDYRWVEAKHIPFSYSLFLRDEDSFFFYSGDNSELNGEAKDLLLRGQLDGLFQDTAKKSHSFHFGLADLAASIPESLRSKVTVMHAPSPEFLEDAKIMGFQVPDLL